jgi:hypothetical protein
VFTKIVGFGDSWMWGDELLDPLLTADTHPSSYKNTKYREDHCFLGLLGKHYNCPTRNFGIPGGSMQSSIWAFLWWLENEPNPSECLVLVGLTEADRFSHFNPNHKFNVGDEPWNRFVHSTTTYWSANKEFEPLIKHQTVLTNCQQLRDLTYQQTVLTFDGIAARRNLNLVQFNVAPIEKEVLFAPTLINPKSNLTNWFVQELQLKFGRKYIKEHGHPNELGHELIKEYLLSYTNSCKING